MKIAPVDQLSAALEATGRVIAGVSDEQWSGPTPCEEWNVRDLVTHLVAGNDTFASLIADVPQHELESDGDLKRAYGDSARALLRAFEEPGALEKVVNVPFGSVPGIVALHLRITEVLVHGWDLARALDQVASFPDDLAEQELNFTRSKLADIPAGSRPFAPPQPVADDAPAIDRLAACLGRDVPPRAPVLAGET